MFWLIHRSHARRHPAAVFAMPRSKWKSKNRPPAALTLPCPAASAHAAQSSGSAQLSGSGTAGPPVRGSLIGMISAERGEAWGGTGSRAELESTLHTDSSSLNGGSNGLGARGALFMSSDAPFSPFSLFGKGARGALFWAIKGARDSLFAPFPACPFV